MRKSDGAFYSALDADSEGVEGKYYVWNFDEFSKAVEGDGDFMVDFFGVTPEGNWESGQNILYCKEDLNSYTLQRTWTQFGRKTQFLSIRKSC